MKYSDLGTGCVVASMIISTAATWIKNWYAGVMLLCCWLIIYGFAAFYTKDSTEKK